MSKPTLTEKQKAILDFVKETILEKGYAPTVREICEKMNVGSTSTVFAHLNALEKKGYIKKQLDKPRCIEIVDDSFYSARQNTVPLPIVGTVAAGEPILAEQNIENYFSLPSEYIPNTTSDIFCLEVKGDSMIEAGILEHDLLIVEACQTAKNGDIVVAMIDDGATVKEFYKEDGHYRLQPYNSSMDPIITDHVEILGKVRSLFRPYVF